MAAPTASPPAAQTYWNKSLNELSIADCAYLATLPKAPSNYNPFRYPERAIERRNWVIDRMVENGFVTKEDAEKAKAEPLGVQVRQARARLAFSEYFAEEVRRDIIAAARGAPRWSTCQDFLAQMNLV